MEVSSLGISRIAPDIIFRINNDFFCDSKRGLGDKVPEVNHSVGIAIKKYQTIFGTDPEQSILVFLYSGNNIAVQGPRVKLVRKVAFTLVTIVAVKAIDGTDPNEPTGVLKQRADISMREAIFFRDGLEVGLLSRNQAGENSE